MEVKSQKSKLRLHRLFGFWKWLVYLRRAVLVIGNYSYLLPLALVIKLASALFDT